MALSVSNDPVPGADIIPGGIATSHEADYREPPFFYTSVGYTT